MDILVPFFLSSLCFLFSSAVIIFTLFFKPRRSGIEPWMLLVWASVFLGAGFGMVEYAVWTGGGNLFAVVLAPNIPLLAFFLAWFVFLAWLFEKHGKRKAWICLLIILIAVILAAVNCMDCVRL